MQRLRTIPGFVRLLVAAFLLAQLAGTVSTPRAAAHGIPRAMPAYLHHDHGPDARGAQAHHHHGDPKAHLGDHCCGLHAFFAGVLPSLNAVDAISVAGERLAAGADDRVSGIPPGRLDRPPRPRR